MSYEDVRVGPLATCAVAIDPDNPKPRIVVSRREGAGPGKPQFRWRLVNWERALVGDRVIVHLRDGIAGLVIRGCAYHPPRRTGERYVLYLDGARGMRLHVRGKPKSRLRRTVERPEIPAAPSPLIGPLMPHIGCPDSLKAHPLDSYFEALDRIVVPTGCNYLSVCPIAYWNDLDIGSPFTLVRGKCDLSEIDPLFEGAFRCLLWRAARSGVAVHLYPFEFVSFNHPSMWARSPLNAAKNKHGWIDEAAPRGYKGFHRILKNGEPPGAREILCDYFQRLSRMIDPRQPHAVVPVLEGQSRRVDINLSMLRQGRPLGINQKSLYQDSAWPAMEQHLSNDPAWRGLLRDAEFISCHSCDSGGFTSRILGRLIPFAREMDFALLASIDGTGAGCGELSRFRRPRGTRPNLDDLIEIWREGLAKAGDRFLGLEIKTLGWEDALEILPAVTGRIQTN